MVAGAWPAVMVAAADGGVHGEDGREREGEGREAREPRELTRSTMVWPARAGEVRSGGDCDRRGGRRR